MSFTSAKEIAHYFQETVGNSCKTEEIVAFKQVENLDEYYALVDREAFGSLLNDCLGYDNQLVNIFLDLFDSELGFKKLADRSSRESPRQYVIHFLNIQKYSYHKSATSKVFLAFNVWLNFFGAPEISPEWKQCPFCGDKIVNNICSRCKGNAFEFNNAFVELERVLCEFRSGNYSPAKIKYYDKIVEGSEFYFSYKRKIDELRERHEEQEKKLKQQIDESVNKKQYYHASGLIKAYKKDYATSKVMLIEQQVDETLAKVNNLFADYERKTYDEKITIAEQALRLCSDSQDAIQLLTGLKLDAPSELICEVNKKGVKVSWKKPDEKCYCTLIRKKGEPPHSIDDGEILSSHLSTDFFYDESIEPAVYYYYAVYASRVFADGVIQVDSEILIENQPVYALFDVENVIQEISEPNIVSVRWLSPQNVDGIVVKKQKNGDTFDAINGKISEYGFADAIENETESKYLIQCRYKIGKSYFMSEGILFAAEKQIRPILPKSLQIVQTGQCSYKVHIDSGIVGELSFYQSLRKHEIKENDVYRKNELTFLYNDFAKLCVTQISECEYEFSVPINTLCFLYPVVTSSTLFAIGCPLTINSTSSLDDIEVYINKNNIEVKGRFAKITNRIIVDIVSKDNLEESVAQTNERFFPYDPSQEISILSIPVLPGRYSVNVSAEYEIGDEVIRSLPASFGPFDILEKTILNYHIKGEISSTQTSRISITFTLDSLPQETSGNLLLLPEMKLIIGNSWHSDDLELAVISDVRMKKGLIGKRVSANVSLLIPPVNGNRKRLFLAWSDDSLNNFKLKQI